MLKLLRISGNSLLPTYRDGDFVLVSKIPYLFGRIRRGDVIAFRHQVYGTMIKEVGRVTPHDDEVYVVGTHDYSLDSREFGMIRKETVVGKVVWHIRRSREGAL
jgi:signal peptidase I